MIVIFQLMVPIWIVSVIFTLPETPRWLIQHGNRIQDARESLARVRDTEDEVENELITIREALEFEKEAISNSYTALFKDPSVRKRLWIAFVLNAGQQVSGQGTLNTYSTIVYGKVFKSSDTVFLINALNATMAIFFTLNATWTVDRYGRKFLFIVGAIGMGFCILIVATVYTQTPMMPGSRTPTLPDGVKTQPVGIAIVFLFFLFSFFCKSSLLRIFYNADKPRQTLLGRHNLDLDLRSLLDECPRPGCRHGLANPEYRQHRLSAILPHLPQQQRFLRLLHVCGNQCAVGCVCVVCGA